MPDNPSVPAHFADRARDLTPREEITVRMLAALVTHEGPAAVSTSLIGKAVELADALVAELYKAQEKAGRD